MRSEKLHAGVTAMPTAPELMTRRDVARLFQVSPITVTRLQDAGKLPAVRLGEATIRYRRSDVEKYITDSITPKGSHDQTKA